MSIKDIKECRVIRRKVRNTERKLARQNPPSSVSLVINPFPFSFSDYELGLRKCISCPSSYPCRQYAEVMSILRLLARVSNNRPNGPLVSPALNCRLNEVVNDEIRQTRYNKTRGEIITYLSGNVGFPSHTGPLIDQYTIGTSTTFKRSTTFYRQKFRIHPCHKKMDLLTDRYHSFRDILNVPPSHYTHLVGSISKFLAEAKHPVTWPRYDEYDHQAFDMLRNLCSKH